MEDHRNVALAVFLISTLISTTLSKIILVPVICKLCVIQNIWDKACYVAYGMTSLFHTASGVFLTHISRWRNRSRVWGCISGEQPGDLTAKKGISHQRYACRRSSEKREARKNNESKISGRTIASLFRVDAQQPMNPFCSMLLAFVCVRSARSVYVFLSPRGKSLAEKHPAFSFLFSFGSASVIQSTM